MWRVHVHLRLSILYEYVLFRFVDPCDHCADKAMCRMHCEHGFVQDADGCDVCECAPGMYSTVMTSSCDAERVKC